MAGFNSYELKHKAYLVDSSRSKQGNDIIIKGNRTTDFPATGNKRVPEGAVVVKKTADGLYYLANDASNGDRNTAPSITSAGHTDGNGVIKLVGNHGTISVTTATGTGTEANNVTDLNADAVFKAHYIASVSGTDVKIEARNPGPDEWFYMHSDTMATAGFAEGDANKAFGTWADYRVVTQQRDTVDLDGNSFDTRPVPTLLAGRFDESELSFLTGDAKAAFLGRGSTFE